jgi:hypothetical protein
VTEKPKTRDERLAEQLEAERKMAEEWDGVSAGGIFSVGKADRVVTAHHEEIQEERAQRRLEADPASEMLERAAEVDVAIQDAHERDERKGNAVGVVIGMLIAVLIALTVMALCNEEPIEPSPELPLRTR